MKKMLMILVVLGILIGGAFSIALDASEESSYDCIEFLDEAGMDDNGVTPAGGDGPGAGPAPG